MSKKPLVIYHGNCADGFGAAWAIWQKHPSWEFYPGIHGEDPPFTLAKDRKVVIVDFSYNKLKLRMLELKATSILILDHHKSAEHDLQEFTGGHFTLNVLPDKGITAIFDMTLSGAMLAWNFFNPNERPPELLSHVQDRDLWQFKLPMTKEISAALFSYEYDFRLWHQLMTKYDMSQLVKEGDSIMRKQTKDIKELIPQTVRTMKIDGWLVLCCNMPYMFASEAGEIVAKNLPFAATYFDTPDCRIFSLRSDQNYSSAQDVSIIASKYGGGGHKHAAGFKVPRDHELAQC